MGKYSDQQIEAFNNKDRRISWLSIFSSLCSAVNTEKFNPTELSKFADELTTHLVERYPFSVQSDDERPL